MMAITAVLGVVRRCCMTYRCGGHGMCSAACKHGVWAPFKPCMARWRLRRGVCVLMLALDILRASAP